MSQPASPRPCQVYEPASFERLPPELLLPIITSLPGLDTLWNLMRASPSAFRVFNSHALTITEGILSGPNSILPPKIREVVRGVILVRSKALPFKNLHEFQEKFLRGSMRWIQWPSELSMALGPETLSVSNVSVTVLRSVVATAYQIVALAQACLASCLERVRALKVSHPVDPKISYTDDFGRPNELIPAFERKYPGKPVKVVDAGQPTWVEEMRVVRAIWALQLVGEVRRLSANKADMINWPDEDIDKLNETDLSDLFPSFHRSLQNQEVKSVRDYLTTLGEATNDEYHRLPQPPPGSVTTRWATALPIPQKITYIVRVYCKDGGIHRLNPGDTVPAGGRPIPCPKPSEDDDWGKTEPALKYASFGANFFRSLTENSAGPGASPIPGVQFDSFSPLGFAFWDRWRMHLLGLAPPFPGGNDYFYFFAWESILPPEEVKRIKDGLREKWWKSWAHYNASLAASRAQAKRDRVVNGVST
ncbi:hypothetical protein CEP54_009983 [Fusarium duplospermum]|uniref:F-box domain-containing protein n=1 Tax=Fusarium duplospermum TaxID=1325734 RepID=A0A428PMI9_9HYPO|nr:hypothetical protein CEP54_009983 [Fusarium duplospermum]